MPALGGTDSGGLLAIQLRQCGEGLARLVGLAGTPVRGSQWLVNGAVPRIGLTASLKLGDGVLDPAQRQVDPPQADART